MDNARIHHAEEIEELVDAYGQYNEVHGTQFKLSESHYVVRVPH